MNSKITSLLLIICFGIIFSCEEEETGCENLGGVIPNHYYTFWIRETSGCTSVITVDIYDENGNKRDQSASNKVIRTFFEPNNCEGGDQSYAKYGLAIGRTFRYEAYCNSASGAKTWEGTFKVPCDANGCTLFEIK
ncbi:hypothetical protein SanaruYs_00370 [Chryseotalea sanaruensis]|uniref:Lipoprotein n=1 Tax=Chryseotalea sanaruensis TaxID=2482724 RepID=A0A401U4I0_9BACT|nr:hypothetical protein [Chryseotalea sanaruensis]GCC49823.1 hypothetical protein SanaruYs_00370 [Chryseotalea sanaruensis]